MIGPPEHEYIYLRANSDRARKKLPVSAACCYEHMPKRKGVYSCRYVYRVPVADFDERLIGGGYHGRISKARVILENVRECWK